MRVLLIKTSSMGDIIHTLPALSDAGSFIPDIKFDWVIEDSFAEIPAWHPLVDKIIPIALRRWRKGLFAKETRAEWKELRYALQVNKYDLIVDAQGLVKSAFLTLFTKGARAGLNWQSARESLASLFYHRKYEVNFYQHAIVRMRQLFALALGYPIPNSIPNFDLTAFPLTNENTLEKYLVFLHGTTWTTKLWPELFWKELARRASENGYRIKISGGNQEEFLRAKRIAENNPAVDVLPRLEISAMARLLLHAKAAVAVDTGFGHLAAALNVPTVSLYGATNANFTGALGKYSLHLSANFPCAPCLRRECNYKGEADVNPACYATLAPHDVWENLCRLLS